MTPARRILLVEDDEDVRGLMARILTDDGLTVDTARTGAEAIQCLHARSFDLVILDIVLPGIDGWGVLRNLRRLPLPPPVMLVTGTAEYQSVLRAAREGVAAYIEKPFSLRGLLATCHSILGGATIGPTTAQADRRGAPRQLVRVPAQLSVQDEAWSTRCEIRDLSRGGAQVAVGTPLPARSSVRLAFAAPGLEHPLSLDSRVQWRAPLERGFAYGFSFVNVPSAQQEQLHRALEMQAP